MVIQAPVYVQVKFKDKPAQDLLVKEIDLIGAALSEEGHSIGVDIQDQEGVEKISKFDNIKFNANLSITADFTEIEYVEKTITKNGKKTTETEEEIVTLPVVITLPKLVGAYESDILESRKAMQEAMARQQQEAEQTEVEDATVIEEADTDTAIEG